MGRRAVILALEIHDAGLVAVADDGSTTLPSPGYAVIDHDEILVGRAAEAKARLVPRRVHNRFWIELDDAPLGRPGSGELSTADLVYAHLRAIRDELGQDAEAVLLVLPGHFSERQLALLLGVARAAGLAVDGLVDQALAAALAGEPNARRLIHLELYLHQVVLSELEHDGEELIRRQVVARAEAGWSVLQNAWARRVAELSVRATRFDPLSSAASEQALYDRLPLWLSELEDKASTSIELAAPGRQLELELAAGELARVARPFYDVVRDLTRTRLKTGTTVLVSSRLAALPGLFAHLAALPAAVVALPRHAAALGALRHQDAIRRPGEEILPFISRLPSPPPSSSSPATSVDAAAEPADDDEKERSSPTHLLCGDLAYPIVEKALWLANNESGPTVEPTDASGSCRIYRHQGRVLAEARGDGVVSLNGRRLVGKARLVTGDLLELAEGIELRLITALPVEARPAEALPAEALPAEARPAEARPAEATDGETA